MNITDTAGAATIGRDELAIQQLDVRVAELRRDLAAAQDVIRQLRSERDDVQGDLTDAQAELRLNATMLATQCDLAREAETKLTASQAAYVRLQEALRYYARQTIDGATARRALDAAQPNGADAKRGE